MDEFLCIGQQVSVRREINFSKFEKFYACEIGYETKIGAFICEGVLVGARSVVTKDVPPFRVVRGNPAGIAKQLVHSQEGDGQ
jgi:acetyltransferase-like isoleucine patch superfamily enzyme